MRLLLAAAVILAHGVAASAHDAIPGAVPQQPLVISGGTIYPVSGEPIEKGVLVIKEGKLAAVGAADAVEIPDGAKRIDATGKHIYPGLFDAYTQVGLVEINAVRATRDMTETGPINPSAQSWKAVNPDSEIIPVTRANGVLLVGSAPTGGLIAGQSAVLQLDGWTWEDLMLEAPVGMHVSWPRVRSRSGENGDPDSALRRLEDLIRDARAYHQAKENSPTSSLAGPPPFDARWEALAPVIEGELPIIAQADVLEEIESAVAFAVRHKLRLIILGGYDAPLAAPLLKKHDVPVIVGGVYRLPLRRDDAYDLAFTVPARLEEAGIPFCIAGASRFAASNVRNLPYQAATAAAYGLSESAALRAITLSPAEVLGVADRVGSLEVGKDATLVIADGNILETPTQVDAAYIQGRPVDLTNKHRQLYKKYRTRLKRNDR